ncbi:nucleoside recognition domain-containing protein [Pasteuria penetrans]|uniref:nucleoside recognition domain-containing protein n=1 Tax=Pasteuria penetrans TaxID=86005 RepID=UPI000FB27B50|nr:nucleoside recognition domain-containing protein [Pasteuria penetrans]
MIHVLWGLLLVTGVVASVWTGRLEEVSMAALNGAQGAIQVCIGLLGVMVLWMGMMRLAEVAGVLGVLARWLRPVVRRLFPDVPVDHPAHGYIVSNIVANLFGLGNAATPSGIKAMQQLQELSFDKTVATPAMCTLLALNTSGLTLVPTLLLGLRMQYHSKDPTSIIVPTLLATTAATIAALFFDRVFRYYVFRYLPNRSRKP